MSEQLKCICIVCRQPMMNYLTNGIQPNRGLAFETHGHYGSTVFDPMAVQALVICVCDFCLTKAAEYGIVYHSEITQLARFEVKPWNGKSPLDGYVDVESDAALGE